MSKKSKKRRAKKRKPPAPAKFSLGIQVRVKKGTTDPDFPDIPLGGWSGTISDVGEGSNPPTYLIEWNQSTLTAMHPVYRKRCERDGLEAESMWLGEDDIEPDTGEPVPIEQPTQIVIRPLKMSDQDDRIRAIFGLTSDDPLPPVDEDRLRKYHDYLATQLRFPFSASYSKEIGFLQDRKHRITVTALLDADENDGENGLLCEAQEDEEKVVLPLTQIDSVGGSNRQLVDDYSYWFGNWQDEAAVASRWIDRVFLPHEIEATRNAPPPSRWELAATFVKLGLLGGFYGANLGAALASLDGAGVAAKVGAVLLAIVVGLFGAKYGHLFGAMNRIRHGNWFGGLVGLVVGGLLGAILGVMLVAFIGTLTGTILGGIVGRYLGSAENRQIRTMLGAVAGAVLGIGVQSWLRSAEDALAGVWIGGVTGAMTAPVLFFGVIFALVILNMKREPD